MHQVLCCYIVCAVAVRLCIPCVSLLCLVEVWNLVVCVLWCLITVLVVCMYVSLCTWDAPHSGTAGSQIQRVIGGGDGGPGRPSQGPADSHGPPASGVDIERALQHRFGQTDLGHHRSLGTPPLTLQCRRSSPSKPLTGGSGALGAPPPERTMDPDSGPGWGGAAALSQYEAPGGPGGQWLGRGDPLSHHLTSAATTAGAVQSCWKSCFPALFHEPLRCQGLWLCWRRPCPDRIPQHLRDLVVGCWGQLATWSGRWGCRVLGVG